MRVLVRQAQAGERETMQTDRKETLATMGLKNVVFPTDFSRTASGALPFAAGLASRFRAALHVVNAAEPANYSLPPETWHLADQTRERETKQVRTFLQTSFPEIESEVQVWEGTVSQVLTSAIDRDHADMIVLGTHGRTGVGKLLLGSAAEAILRTAPCPVLTLGPHARTEPEWQLHQILYATDFSPASIEGVQYAIAFAQAYNAKLALLHVIETRETDELVHEAELTDSSRRLLRKLVPEDALPFEPRCEVIQGAAADAIIEVARRLNAGLIVLGARRASGATSHLPVATVHKVIAQAPCPVLTVRHMAS